MEELNRTEATASGGYRKMIDPEKYPPNFARQEVEKIFPGFITAGTLANLAAKGEGPPFIKGRMGKAIYNTKEFLRWYFEDYSPENPATQGAL